MGPTVRLLFVCVENSCRSQMAEGFARIAGRPGVAAWSAGSRPSGRVDPRAVEFMRGREVDLSRHRSKGLEDLPRGVTWDYVVTMGCGDACSGLPARERLDWDLEDPKRLDDGGFARVGGEIERRVLDLLRRVSRSERLPQD